MGEEKKVSLKLSSKAKLRMGLFITCALMTVHFFCLIACQKSYTPKPRGYFRFEFPEKAYHEFTSECNFGFEVPMYSKVIVPSFTHSEPCWYNVEFTGYNSRIHLTYKPLKNTLSTNIEDIRKIVYKHIAKADDIIETPLSIPDHNVYGILYDIKGNAATSVNFYVTDSVNGFLSGSLYFDSQPNADSLAPAISFFRDDVIHIINTLHWE